MQLPEELFPQGSVAVCETRHLLDLGSARGGLLAPELPYVASAAPVRVREFGTGRACARQALRGLAIGAVPILPDRDRSPLWPDGVAGSITHCQGYCAAAVAHVSAISLLGIDAEPHEPLPWDVSRLVVLPSERARHDCLPIGPAWDTVAFSAKEAVFKAVFPADRQWREFTDVEVKIDACGAFDAFRAAGPFLPVLTGRWRIAEGLVLTAAYGASSR